MIAFLFSFIFPVLLVSAGVLAVVRRYVPEERRRTAGLGVVAGVFVVALIPVGGAPLARWVIGVNANFSIVLTTLLLSSVVASALGRPLLDERATLSLWVIVATAGAIMYPLSQGLGGYDPYAAGWGFSWAHVVLMGLTVWLIWVGNRTGIVLLMVAVAWQLQLLESANLWDYLVDPFLFAIALAALVWRGVGAYRRRS